MCWTGLDKRYFRKDQQLARHFVHYSECLHYPLPFYVTQIINPLLTKKGKDFSQ